MFHSGDDIGAIIADIGTNSTRIGFAGDDTPKVYTPTALGSIPSLSSESANPTSGPGSILHPPFKYIAEQEIVSPIHDGLITDWDLLEKLWSHHIEHILRTNLEGLPVLIAEKPYVSPQQRHKWCELLFEKYKIGGLFLSKDVILSCYACGRTMGLVVDCGASSTILGPVIDGWSETKGLTRHLVGGRIMDQYYLQLVSQRRLLPLLSGSGSGSGSSSGIGPGNTRPRLPYQFTKLVHPDRNHEVTIHPIRGDNGVIATASYHSYCLLELSRAMKEVSQKMAATNLQENEMIYASMPLSNYELPDGTMVDLGLERFQVSELWFDSSPLFGPSNKLNSNSIGPLDSTELQHLQAVPAELSSSSSSTEERKHGAASLPPAQRESITKLIIDAILKCDGEHQTALLSSIILAGGGSTVEGLQERIKVEIEKLLVSNTAHMKVKVVANAPSERPLTAWLGGSILGSLGSFHEMWVNKREYEEYGSVIVDKKCP